MDAKASEKKGNEPCGYFAFCAPKFLWSTAMGANPRTFMDFFAAPAAPNHTGHLGYPMIGKSMQ